jgi:hypothetical protein
MRVTIIWHEISFQERKLVPSKYKRSMPSKSACCSSPCFSFFGHVPVSMIISSRRPTIETSSTIEYNLSRYRIHPAHPMAEQITDQLDVAEVGVDCFPWKI